MWSWNGLLAYESYDWLDDRGVIRIFDSSFCCEIQNPPARSPEWAPDGSALVFSYNRQIARQNVDGTGFTYLTNGTGAAGGAHRGRPMAR